MNIKQSEMLLFYSLLKDELKSLDMSKPENTVYAQNLADTMNRIKKSWQRDMKRAKRLEALTVKQLREEE